MEKMKTQTIYIEVPVSELKGWHLAYDTLINQDNGKKSFVEKKEDQIVMSKEEFEKAIGDAFTAGKNRGLYVGHPNKETYLATL